MKNQFIFFILGVSILYSCSTHTHTYSQSESRKGGNSSHHSRGVVEPANLSFYFHKVHYVLEKVGSSQFNIVSISTPVGYSYQNVDQLKAAFPITMINHTSFSYMNQANQKVQFQWKVPNGSLWKGWTQMSRTSQGTNVSETETCLLSTLPEDQEDIILEDNPIHQWKAKEISQFVLQEYNKLDSVIRYFQFEQDITQSIFSVSPQVPCVNSKGLIKPGQLKDLASFARDDQKFWGLFFVTQTNPYFIGYDFPFYIHPHSKKELNKNCYFTWHIDARGSSLKADYYINVHLQDRFISDQSSSSSMQDHVFSMPIQIVHQSFSLSVKALNDFFQQVHKRWNNGIYYGAFKDKKVYVQHIQGTFPIIQGDANSNISIS